MGLAGSFGEAVAGQATPDEIDCAVEIGQVTGRDVDRGDAIFSAQDDADLFIAVGERGPAAGFESEFAVISDENAFRAADRGDSEPEAGVAGDAEAARMRQSLSVKDHGLGSGLKFLPCLEQRREFAEAEQAGNVREAGCGSDSDGFDYSSVGSERTTIPA